MRAGAAGVLLVLAGCQGTPRSSEPAPAPVLESGSEVAPDATPEPDPLALLNEPPEGFVDLRTFVPDLRVHVRYHGSDNFTGKPLTGYGAPGAWMVEPAAVALREVQASLAEEGLGLLVYDAYRPVRGTLAMVAWAERSGRVDVLDDGYVARKSGHNRGNTVDLTLISLESGEPLEMGTPWDTFSTDSHTANAEGEAAENRRRLVQAMRARGWENYTKEWWHFSFPMQPPPPPRDVPYGCFEPVEGEWTAPPGWNEEGYEPPGHWPSPQQAGCE